MFSGSAEGGLSVWENRGSDRDPLRLLHHWNSQVTGCGGEACGRLTLSPRGDRVFLAYGRAWLKILHWRTGRLCVCQRGRSKKEGRFSEICIILPPNICPIITGTMTRLTNHSSITGVTDCIHQTGGLLIGSCYDLANGESRLNCESHISLFLPLQVLLQSPHCFGIIREPDHFLAPLKTNNYAVLLTEAGIITVGRRSLWTESGGCIPQQFQLWGQQIGDGVFLPAIF